MNLSRIYQRLKDGLNGSRIYREAIERKPRNLNGSRIGQESIKQTKSSESFFDGLRSYQDSIEKKPRNLDGSGIYRGSIEKRERRLDRKRIYRGSVKKLLRLKKMSFSREEKCIKMNATRKLLKQTSKPHIKLSKHLLTYMQSIHRSKHAHTHTKQV